MNELNPNSFIFWSKLWKRVRISANMSHIVMSNKTLDLTLTRCDFCPMVYNDAPDCSGE
jgi:hypothetical protein